MLNANKNWALNVELFRMPMKIGLWKMPMVYWAFDMPMGFGLSGCESGATFIRKFGNLEMHA